MDSEENIDSPDEIVESEQTQVQATSINSFFARRPKDNVNKSVTKEKKVKEAMCGSGLSIQYLLMENVTKLKLNATNVVSLKAINQILRICGHI